MLTVTIGALRSAGACDLEARIESLEKHLGRKVPDGEFISLAEWAPLEWETHEGKYREYTYTKDLLWALRVAYPPDERDAAVARCENNIRGVLRERNPSALYTYYTGQARNFLMFSDTIAVHEAAVRAAAALHSVGGADASEAFWAQLRAVIIPQPLQDSTAPAPRCA